MRTFCFLTLSALCISTLALSACGGRNVAGQIRTVMLDQDTLPLKDADTWMEAPTLILFDTSETTTITGLFVAEFHAPDLPRSWIKVRLLLDGQAMLPTEATVASRTSPQTTGAPGYNQVDETHSFMAMKPNVPAGSHKLTVEWKANIGLGLHNGTFFLSAPTLTMWEGVKQS